MGLSDRDQVSLLPIMQLLWLKHPVMRSICDPLQHHLYKAMKNNFSTFAMSLKMLDW